MAGRFIAIDGPDGAGKSTQIRALRDHLVGEGARVEVVVDPGTTRIGEKIRALLLDRDNGEIGLTCETFLFMASRSQLVQERIRPALADRKVVLCDRFVSATLAYQGASGMDAQTILKLGEIATGGLWPDLTVILDVPADVGFRRIGVRRERLKKPRREEIEKLGAPRKRGRQPEGLLHQLRLFGDRLEARSGEYHERVRQVFKQLPAYYPGKVRCIDATGTQEQASAEILAVIREELGR